MCNNELIIDFRRQNETKDNRIFFLVQFGLTFDKTQKIKVKNSSKSQSENKKLNNFMRRNSLTAEEK